MPSIDVQRMRAALFVEVEGETKLVMLPHERMKLLLPLAASLFDSGKLELSPTRLFDFNAALESVMVPHGVTVRGDQVIAPQVPMDPGSAK